MTSRRAFMRGALAISITPILPRETFANIPEAGPEPQAAGPFLDQVETYFRQRTQAYEKFGPFRIHHKHREEAYHFLSYVHYKITMMDEIVPYFRAMPFDARQAHRLLIQETIKHHQRVVRFGAVGDLWRTHHLQDMLTALDIMSRGETPAQITAKGFRRHDSQIAKMIDDRVPPFARRGIA